MPLKHFTISLPTDQGFFGRKCPDETCGKYFKVHQDHIGEILFCPYCGTELKGKELFTQEQTKYINKEAERVITDYAAKEFEKMLSDAFKGNKYVKFTPSPQRHVFKTSSIKEKKVDTEIECPDCHTRFQVYGIFGYCPNCHTENIMIYDANLQIIRNEVLSSSNQYRVLRHAYDDLVSTFDTFCSHISQKNGLPESKFQNIFETRRYFKDSVLQIDILNGLSDQEILTLRRVFQKRHVNIHDKGIINEKYIQFIPEDQKLLGLKVTLTLEEFENAAVVLKKVILNLI